MRPLLGLWIVAELYAIEMVHVDETKDENVEPRKKKARR